MPHVSTFALASVDGLKMIWLDFVFWNNPQADCLFIFRCMIFDVVSLSDELFNLEWNVNEIKHTL